MPPIHVPIRDVKELAKRLPRDHPLRKLIELEPDELPPEVFASQAGVWLRLLEAA
jgi:hypothetical protein